mmetsp:Transcript_37782/g.75653  ORF Transcript_37782/g.75653 Transcript_37782/m.75653 type:complete len:126 (+) Transcript_37782:66-443(+)
MCHSSRAQTPRGHAHVLYVLGKACYSKLIRGSGPGIGLSTDATSEGQVASASASHDHASLPCDNQRARSHALPAVHSPPSPPSLMQLLLVDPLTKRRAAADPSSLSPRALRRKGGVCARLGSASS